MLADRSYREVREIAVSELEYDPEGEFYTKTGDLRRLANEVGVEISAKRRRPFKEWGSLPDRAIVAINYKRKTDTWHWVVFVRKNGKAVVLDPKRKVKTTRRTDFGRMNPFAFLPLDTLAT